MNKNNYELFERANKAFSYDDILIKPKFSTIKSRQDVNLKSSFLDRELLLPIMNANMDTVASVDLCNMIAINGGMGALHRFMSIEENVQMYLQLMNKGCQIVSVGISENEFERVKELVKNTGVYTVLIDVAHAANQSVVNMFKSLVSEYPQFKYIVGNFGNGDEVIDFLTHCGDRKPEAVKIGIGGGSLCTTRLVTGVGVPSLYSIMDCYAKLQDYNDNYHDIKIIADGGIRHIGDIVKALVAGADMVMLGSMFAGTDETPGSIITNHQGTFKEYRGSASFDSYKVQGKIASWRAPEGEATLVQYKGPIVNILNAISGGIRSACSYVGASNLVELREKSDFIFVTNNTVKENSAHGK